jgi:hypothetical protein
MVEKTLTIRFTARDLAPVAFTAERAEFHGSYLVLRTTDGELAAMFLLDVVESWAEVKW